MHNLALFPINPEPQRLSPATGFKEICDARLSKLTAISSTEFSMFICKQHLRIIALSFYSVKQKTGVFYKNIKFFVYFDISFYLSIKIVRRQSTKPYTFQYFQHIRLKKFITNYYCRNNSSYIC